MDALQRFDIKIVARKGEDIPSAEFVPVLQRWIQDHRVEGTLVDVADYGHTHQGPGVILIGHEANIGIDYAEGCMGLLYKRRQDLEGTLAERFRFALTRALEAARLLEEEESFAGRLEFDGGEILVIANDRLNAPNNEDASRQLLETVAGIAEGLYDTAPATCCSEGDARLRPTIQIKASGQVTVQDVIDRVSAS